jgi:hypothetical protein
MSDTASSTVPADSDRFVYTSEICADVGITDRCLRKWIVKGLFPSPDANLRGRNCWRLASFRTWKSAVLAGKYRQQRRPGVSVQAEPSAA